MFQRLQTCSDVSRFLKKDEVRVEAGRRVLEQWFYIDRDAEEEFMINLSKGFGRAENM